MLATFGYKQPRKGLESLEAGKSCAGSLDVIIQYEDPSTKENDKKKWRPLQPS